MTDAEIIRDALSHDDSLNPFKDHVARLLDALERRTEALRYFIGAQHPVSTEIDDRGHRWVEAYLDEALPHAIAAMKGQT